MKTLMLVYNLLLLTFTSVAAYFIWDGRNVIHWRLDVIVSLGVLLFMGYFGSLTGLKWWYEDHIKMPRKLKKAEEEEHERIINQYFKNI